jgi:hypothetical protein
MGIKKTSAADATTTPPPAHEKEKDKAAGGYHYWHEQANQGTAPRAQPVKLSEEEAKKLESQARSVITPVPVRPRRRGARRSLRTFLPGVSLRPPLAFNPRARRLSTPFLTPFNSTPTFVRSYGTALRNASAAASRRGTETGRRGRSAGTRTGRERAWKSSCSGRW